MTESHEQGLRPIRRALLSVSDKTGLVEFARVLLGYNVELLSTGGTAQALRAAGLAVRDVADVTGFPEMLDGRVKTLHPRIHGGILAVRADAAHAAALRAHAIEPIDLVVVNLYPFAQTVARAGVTLAEAIEQIDIGGPALLRSAAKNCNDVAVVTDPRSYEFVERALAQHAGALPLALRRELARQAFAHTAAYDGAISAYLNHVAAPVQATERPPAALADVAALHLSKLTDLRYGENPHQQAALYSVQHSFAPDTANGIAQAAVVAGKEMSYNNYVDADAAWQLVCDFAEPACAIIKHTNPAGVGVGTPLAAAYRRALATDPVSAFGGIVAFNRTVDEAAAQAVVEIFTEVIVAPDFDAAALAILQTKKNLRVLRAGVPTAATGLEYRQITGGLLGQTRDTHQLTPDMLKVVSRRAPTDDEVAALLFAWTVCKHTKSNAIVYARAGQTVGVGAGQMSRVDAVRLGALRAQLPLAGTVLASDAFFPFRDGLDEAARHGITAVIQPGGSVRDAEVIAAADEHNLALVYTGIRHFKH